MVLNIEQQKAELHAAIEKMPNGSIELLSSLVPEFVSSRKEIKAVFLARSIQALIAISEEVPVEKAMAASSDYDLFLTLLQQPEVMRSMPSRDPLAEARIRGLMASRQLLEMEGGCMSSSEVAAVLSIKRQAVDKRRVNGKLIGLPSGRAYVYPAWQFVDGQTLPKLEKILKHLNIRDPWMQTAWMLNGNSRLEGLRPLDVLHEGNEEVVLKAARSYGEQGAA